MLKALLKTLAEVESKTVCEQLKQGGKNKLKHRQDIQGSNNIRPQYRKRSRLKALILSGPRDKLTESIRGKNPALQTVRSAADTNIEIT